MSEKTLQSRAFELLELEAISAMDSATFQGSRFDGWRVNGGVKDGPEIKARILAYIAEMQKAIQHYDNVVAAKP